MASKRYNDWKARIAIWRREYNIAEKQVERPRNAICVYCLTSKQLTRHHKGHEYYFACLLPEAFARRYLEFHDDDIVVLCERHHRYLHKLYKPIVAECNAYIKLCKPKRFGWRVQYVVQPSPEVLESYRQRLIHRCNHFLERKRNARTPRK